MKKYSDVSLGILSMLASAFFFALMNACVKALSPQMDSVEIIFWRSIVMVLLMLGIFLLPFLKFSESKMQKNVLDSQNSSYKPQNLSQCFKNFMQKNKHTYKDGGYFRLFLRSLFGGLSMLALFYNINDISLGVASTFHQTCPIFVALISVFFMREKVGSHAIFFTFIGFVGIVLICDPNFGDPIAFKNILLGIFSGFGMALAFITLRSLRDFFGSNVIVFSFGVVMSVVSLFIWGFQTFFYGENFWVLPDFKAWVIILAMGIVGTFGQHFLTKAYILAPAGIVAPIDYSRVVFSLCFGIILGDALPNLSTTFGIFLVILSGVLIGLPVFIRDLRAMKS